MAKHFIRKGRVNGYDVLFIGNFAFPRHLAYGLLVALYAGTFVWAGVDHSAFSWGKTVFLSLLVLAVVVVGGYWLIRLLVWSFKAIRAVNGGRVN